MMKFKKRFTQILSFILVAALLLQNAPLASKAETATAEDIASASEDLEGVLKNMGIKWTWLNDRLWQFGYMQINNDDSRAWIYSTMWWSASLLKRLIGEKNGKKYPYNYLQI